MHTKTDGATGRPTGDAGYALPMAVFTLVLLSVMGAASLQTSRDELLSAVAVNSSSRAFYAAEAGIHNAVSTWNQSSMDTLVGGPGDTFVDSWTAIENGCSYQVEYRRIDGNDGPFRLYSVESTGKSPELDGGMQRVGIIMKAHVIVLPGIAYDGWLGISGNPTVKGACSSVHTNSDSLFVSGSPAIGSNISVSGSTTYGGGIPTDTLGNPIAILGDQPEINVPQLWSTDHCGAAEYIFDTAGQGLQVSTGQTWDFTDGSVHWGWKYVPGPPTGYESASPTVAEGVYCVDGNMSLGDVGVAANPAELTLLTTGSVQITGNPYMVTAHPDSILIMADGDLSLSGNPTAGSVSLEGLLYGGAQCRVSGNPVIFGQLVCKGNPNTANQDEWAVISEITGDMQLTYSCGGLLGSRSPTPLDERPWSHVW